jgi:hypothetical protein|tara:strand:- start:1524 stop:2096 length:573 start_codon:yes stop_codon:yes gene_type:complete
MSKQTVEILGGIAVGYGPRSADNDTGSLASGDGDTKILTLRVNLKNVGEAGEVAAGTKASNATTNIYQAGYWAHAPVIPANSTILSTTAYVDVAAVGGSAILFLGTWTINTDTGVLTADEASAFHDASSGAVTALTPAGKSMPGDGAAIGTVSHSADTIVVPSLGDTNDFSAGEVTLVVRFKPPHDSALG